MQARSFRANSGGNRALDNISERSSLLSNSDWSELGARHVYKVVEDSRRVLPRIVSPNFRHIHAHGQNGHFIFTEFEESLETQFGGTADDIWAVNYQEAAIFLSVRN